MFNTAEPSPSGQLGTTSGGLLAFNRRNGVGCLALPITWQTLVDSAAVLAAQFNYKL